MSEENAFPSSSETDKLLSKLTKKRLILFLSVDIVGSTHYKQTRGQESADSWLEVFYGFYDEFFSIFVERIKEKSDQYSKKANTSPEPQAPALLKSLGDELIYYIDLKHHTNAYFYCNCFKEAVALYHDQLAKKSLGLKATGWIAGFPVGNTVLLSEVPSEKREDDFIGPLMDIGFRIAKLSLPQRFSISVDLAYILTVSNKFSSLEFNYSGRVPLKGVLREEPYPHIWIRVKEEKFSKEPKVRKNYLKCEPSELHAYCEEYIREIGLPLRFPFIEGDDTLVLKGDAKNEYSESYNRVLKKWKEVLK